MPKDNALYKFKQGEVNSRLFPTQVFGHQSVDWNLKVPQKLILYNVYLISGDNIDNRKL